MKNKILMSLIALAGINATAFAQEPAPIAPANSSESLLNLKPKHHFIDLIGDIGITGYSGMSGDNPSMIGANLGGRVLFSLINSNFGTPVIGGGLNLVFLTKQKPGSKTEPEGYNWDWYNGYTGGGSTNYTTDNNMYTFAVEGNAGYKFYTASPKLNIIALANFGYGPFDFQSTTLTATYTDAYGTQYDPQTNTLSSTSIKNHWYAGGSVNAFYELNPGFSVGGGITYNHHSFTLELPKQDLASTASEISVNFTVMTSI